MARNISEPIFSMHAELRLRDLDYESAESFLSDSNCWMNACLVTAGDALKITSQVKYINDCQKQIAHF